MKESSGSKFYPSGGLLMIPLLTIIFCLAVAAQTYQGRIMGSVADQNGAAVRGAKVTITNVGTGVARALETNEAGDYVASNLPPGLYKITVEAGGFKKVERPEVRLEVAKDVRIDVALQPGAVAETVTIAEDAPLIETANNTLGGTFSNKAINDLPLNGRDFQNLVVLRPGVQRSPGGGFLSISSNGNRPENNNFIILGLKSGTNEIHGTAYGFERNNVFDARNFFNTDDSPQRALRQHQFGGSVGG